MIDLLSDIITLFKINKIQTNVRFCFFVENNFIYQYLKPYIEKKKNNNTIIVSITNNAAVLSNNVTGNGQATITAIGPSDGAAEDGGLIVKGSTDKSIKWKGTDGGVAYNTWVSSENFDLAANKIFSLRCSDKFG